MIEPVVQQIVCNIKKSTYIYKEYCPNKMFHIFYILWEKQLILTGTRQQRPFIFIFPLFK